MALFPQQFIDDLLRDMWRNDDEIKLELAQSVLDGQQLWLERGTMGLPYETEQLLHGHLAAVDDSVRAFVLEGEGRAAERARDAVRALEALGCETTLVSTRHPVVDIVRFQLLTLAIAERRGIDPDSIRRTPGSPWAAAAGEAYPG